MMMSRKSTTSSGLLLLLIWIGNLCGVADSTNIYQSTASLDLSLEEVEDALSVENVYALELNTAAYVQEEINNAIPNMLDLEVAVKNLRLEEGTLTVFGKVTVTYLSNVPIPNFAATLDENVDQSGAAAAIQATNALITFGAEGETKAISNIPEDTSADTGLVAAVVCLSIALFIISSVVCYTSGGFAAFTGCCLSHCFKEVNDENGDLKQVETFPAQSYDEEHSVVESSVAGTAADGILGAVGNDQSSVNPAEGLGIKTPIRGQSNITGSEFGDDSVLDATPMSEVTPNNTSARPLGIMSMRKLAPPTPDTQYGDNDDAIEYGLSRMVLGRLKNAEKH